MKWAFGRRFFRFGITSIRFAAVPVLTKIQFEDAKREIYYSSCGIQGYRKEFLTEKKNRIHKELGNF